MRSLTRKRSRLGILAGATLALCTSFTGAPSVSTAGALPQAEPIPSSRIVQGKKLAPVPLDLIGKNRTMVYLGSYLVNAVGGCNDCHTVPSYTDNPFAGDPGVVNATNYLAGGRAFGPFVSANITPDGSGKPHGLDRDEFVALMRTGYDADESRYLQVMPWPVYRNMTDQDLHAIYEYLSAIPHAEPAP
ncbi:MAG: cytochrome C [Deltaproteobacteria bacterium]|nr:cytochrome C [Deltaproteobacteria bacterium]